MALPVSIDALLGNQTVESSRIEDPGEPGLIGLEGRGRATVYRKVR